MSTDVHPSGGRPQAEVNLPGGGDLIVRHSDSLTQIVDQHFDNGRAFRWLCSSASSSSCSSANLTAETIVELNTNNAPSASSPATRRTSKRQKFIRDTLLPEYHVAMVAGLGLRRASSPLRHMLFLGVGGAALSQHLAQQHPRCLMTGVEASSSMIELAIQYFGCQRRGPRWRLHCCSAQSFLRRFPSGSYDAIFLDASCAEGGFAPPKDLCTSLAFRGLHMRLRPGGCLIANALGGAAHLDEVSTALVNAFTDDDDSSSRIWLLRTSEGNNVLVGVREPASSVVQAPACPAQWMAACSALGLRVERLDPKGTNPKFSTPRGTR